MFLLLSKDLTIIFYQIRHACKLSFRVGFNNIYYRISQIDYQQHRRFLLVVAYCYVLKRLILSLSFVQLFPHGIVCFLVIWLSHRRKLHCVYYFCIGTQFCPGNEDQFYIIKDYFTDTKVSHGRALTRNVVFKVAWY